MMQLGNPKKRSRIARIPSSSSLSPPFFNDPSSSDFLLSLVPPSDSSSQLQIHLHSPVIRRRSKFFDALLSDRWLPPPNSSSPPGSSTAFHRQHLTSHPVDAYVAVLRLLYAADAGDDLSASIGSASSALDLLPVALELLFEDLIRSCVRFLEAVPWTEEEEARVISLVPLLGADESRDLLARVSPSSGNSCEEMLHGLILTAIHNHSNMAFAKAFVAKILRDLSDREAARRVLERAFETSLKIVKESLEEYSSPDFRGDHNETEAIQRLNLHTAMTNARHLLWLVERMIELRVADTAVKEWSDQASFTADLQRAFRDDAWRNIVPGFPALVLRCTSRLANAVASGTILASTLVRTRLVKDWLPVLIVCKDNVSPMLSSHKSLYTELEDTFLSIISTLPLSDAQGLLQQCLSFSTRSVEDCPHLVTAFNTWFRRAARSPLPENNS
ncbi:BTB/POZ domain-containing protein At1g63850-like [Punica granatum]|uniref:BTB/POZ domain-containing protein At1g63850-like n=2 Tax=Punica granatum TaxID=22663 RepID=A0A218XQP9_PUNGR|nr:BTB/POZ domain-containing protein At1g63850-like [Punica granatum]OWM87264.1 hypothetical protein CDL15_Pgr019311 [Punica granatum]